MQQSFRGDSFQRINHLLPASASDESYNPGVIDPSETYYIRDYIPNPTNSHPSLDDHSNDHANHHANGRVNGRDPTIPDANPSDFLQNYEEYPSSSNYVTAGPSNVLSGPSNAIAGPSTYQNTSSTASSIDTSYLAALHFDQPAFTDSYAAVDAENGAQFREFGGLGTFRSTDAVDYSTTQNFLSWDMFEDQGETVAGMAMAINESK